MTPRQREGTQRRRRLLARLIGLNMLGLIILAGGFLVLSGSRQFLTNAYKQSLEAQARIVAGAEPDSYQSQFQFDPSCLARCWRARRSRLGDTRSHQNHAPSCIRYHARIRLYGRDGALVLDSAHMDRSINVISRALPPLPGTSVRQDWRGALRLRFAVSSGVKNRSDGDQCGEEYNLPEVVSAIKDARPACKGRTRMAQTY